MRKLFRAYPKNRAGLPRPAIRRRGSRLCQVGAITYTGLVQGVIAYLSIFGWYELMESVNTGEVSADLLKPMNYFAFWLAKDLGRAVVNFFLRGAPMLFIYALLFDIVLPGDGWQWLALGVALVLSWLVSFAWRFLVNLAVREPDIEATIRRIYEERLLEP